MKELKCPKCGNVFSVDEADYALLLSQVKNSEFEAELARRIHDIEQMQQARLDQADKKLEDVTIKRLTYGNPTMKAKFDEARENN